MKDTLTILLCDSDHIATKTHRMTVDGIVTDPYDAGYLFTGKEITVGSIHDLSYVLSGLEPIVQAIVVRGAPMPHVNLEVQHLRRKYSPANYATPASGRHYVMVDIDKLQLPSGVTISKVTVPKIIEFVIHQLPGEFQDASFHWQLSSSAGVSSHDRVSVHLWFWLDRPISDTELKRWGKAVNISKGFNLIDTTLFNDVQPHYTAAPVFIDMNDPIPVRSGFIQNKIDFVSLVVPPEEERCYSAPGRVFRTASNDSSKGFDYWLDQIGDHPGGDGFHEPIMKATASYVSSCGDFSVGTEWLYETVRARVLAADASRHPPSEVRDRASREHIMPLIEGAIRKFGNQGRQRSRTVPGVAPHFESKVMPLDRAGRLLHRLVRKALAGNK